MADYDCCDPRLTTSSSLETAVSSSQALPNSTSESMWEGWTLASPPVSQCALTEQLQQHLGGGFTTSSAASAKSGSSYQHDLLSSWLMSGYQSVNGLHQQQQQQAQHGGEERSGVTTMYQDEFSRMNICSSTSSDYHGSVASPSAAAGGESTEATHQNLYDVMQTCSSSVQTGSSSGGPTVEVVGQSAEFLNTPPSDNDHHHIEAAAHKLDDHGKQKMMHQMNNHPTVAELRSRASSSSPPSGLNNSYAQTTLQQHLSGGQFDSSNYWASAGSTAATVTSPSPQRSICSVGDAGLRSSGHHREDQPNMGCDSIILHHQHHQNQQHRSKKGCEGDEAVFHNSGTDLTTDQMYTELHVLLGKSLDAHTHGAAADLHHQQVASNAAGSYGDHSNWTQFTVGHSLSVPSAHAEGFMGMPDIADRTMFESSTADSLSTAATHATAAARREESSPSSAGTAMSTIHNFTAAAAANLAAHATMPYNRSSSSTDLESSDMRLQRKRPLSQGSEQVGSNAEDSVKRSCIAQHRNLWQLQSQALFGRLPTNFLMGGSSSSNSGSMDLSTAVGPALNTNGRPRARRGSATDPQSLYARHRRERINDRLKVLQHLVPNGAKVDIVTMLEEAINYVKFLQFQVRLLSSDELWSYAPTTYNGMDVSMGMHAGLLDQQA